MSTEGNKAVVTGGCGFIGSHLVERLLEDGFSVTVLDNFASGRRSNLAGFEGHPRLQIVDADLASPNDRFTSYFKTDFVFHLAALADIVPSLQNPLNYFRSNVTGTAHVLEAARTWGIKKIIYAASSSCYGLAKIIPTPETAPIAPEYPYALTKYLGEELVLHWSKVFNIPAVSMRFFNVYGPRSRTTGAYGAVFGVFLKQKLAGQPLTIVGDGKQTRDFTFVTDVVDAMMTASRSNATGDIFNVGSGKTVSVNYLAELLGGPKTYIPKRPGEPDCTFADTSKIQRLLGWKPKVSFEEGVKIMLKNIENWRDAPLWTPDSIKEATKEWFHYLSRPQPQKVNS